MSTVNLPAQLECKKCGHRWIPRTADVRICPRCKTARWDAPRTRRSAERAAKSYLTAKDDPVLAKLWDNDYDAIYDDM